MKKVILFLGILFIATACNKSVTPITQPETPDPIVAHVNPYQYMGTTTLYSTPDSAYQNRTFGRPYYRDIPVLSPNLVVYQNSVNSQKVDGNNKWIAITKDNGVTWTSVQLANRGIIIAVKGY